MSRSMGRCLVFMAALAVCCVWTLATVAAERTKPNVLLILADDHRPDCIAALGNPHLKTPTLDRLVDGGVSFSHAYTLGSTEGAVCCPSRSMLLTGRTLFHLPQPLRQPLSQFEKTHPEGVPMLMPRVLSAAGYETIHIGKGGNECTYALQAFDTNVVYDDDTPELRVGSSQRHADAAIGFLRQRTWDRPFFLYLAPPVPHDPRVCPRAFSDQYDPAKIPVPVNFLPVHPFDNGDLKVRDEQLAPWPRTPEIVQRHLADYYACITNLDLQLGRILDSLKELGQLDNTIIVFAGDNGLSLGEHGLFGKQNLYEFGGMHVPLVVAGPGISKGRSDALVYLADLMPTLCDMLKIETPSCADGKSLAPILRGQAIKPRDFLFTAYNGPQGAQRAIRDDRWKLIRYPQIQKTQLFDLQTDPRERNDLSDRPEHAERLHLLLEQLRLSQKQYGDDVSLGLDP